jgi:phosphoribosyl 1,2-cyclic phosphate phosphodiesterase
MSVPSFSVTFLGTGTSGGVPLVGCDCFVCSSPFSQDKRLRSSILVQSESTVVVIDATPDFRQQMLLYKVKKLDGVLITHAHKDHVGGIDDTRPFQYFQQGATQVFGSPCSMEGIRREIPYAFDDNPYPGVPNMQLHELKLQPFMIGNIPFIPILVWHHYMPVWGFRIGNFTYITDANRIDEEEKEKMRGSHTLVLNALRKAKHISHFTLSEAVDLATELQVEQAYFTHISHQLGTHAEINAELPSHMQLAYDGLQLQFDAV